MRHSSRCAVLAALLAGLAPFGRASDLSIDGVTAATALPGETTTWTITGTPGAPVFLLLDLDDGPTVVFGQSLELGFTPALQLSLLPPIPGSGVLSFDVALPLDLETFGIPLYALAAVADAPAPALYDYSNGASLTLARRSVQLAGEPLPVAPHFQFVRAFNAGESLHVGVDPHAHPQVVGVTADVYVVAARSAEEWALDDSLVDLTGDGADVITFAAGSITDNILVVDGGALSADAGADIGVAYDVVVDLDRDGLLGPDDLIDGGETEAGLYVVHDLTLPGPYAVTETLYSGGSFLGQNTFYPTNVAELGELPLVVMSHGNGHNYQWYDHVGFHLASYGYVVMSHQNNTVPGVGSAATTTLTNTDWFLGNLDLIDGGVLVDHINRRNITWMGHSRGGEGIVIAYDRLVDAAFVPANYGASDIALLSSIAPTAFNSIDTSDPHGVPFHVWVGGADADVSGCPTSNATQSFHLHDRAANMRHSISLHGVGHGDFHNSTGSVASGPCLVGKSDTHRIMRGYALPLVAHHIRRNLPAEEFLWRQWESFRPVGAPLGGCVVVDLSYRQSAAEGKFVVDDFQSGNGWELSSSGGLVTATVSAPLEGVLDDPNNNFTFSSLEPFNGFTQARTGDTTRGMVFEYSADAEISFEVVPAAADGTRHEFLSFRACQVTRHPFTTAHLGDTTFTVELADGRNVSSAISIGAYGGGLEEPYQRTSCGTGTGWGNEFETIRIRLTDFTRDGSGLDLSDLARITLRFGPSWGTAQGRVGLDDLELISE